MGVQREEKCVTVCGAPMIEAQTLGLASRPSPPLLRDTQERGVLGPDRARRDRDLHRRCRAGAGGDGGPTNARP